MPRKAKKMLPGEPRKKIGVALGGGASKGLAHIGVLKALEDARVPVDFIAGTSMGAVVGGWYALNGNISSMEEVVSGFKRKERDMLAKISLVKGKPKLRDGSIMDIIDKNFGKKDMADCKIPFSAVATNVKNGDQVVLSKGKIAEAIKASASIPIIFNPIEIDKKVLVDGGLINPVPADVVRDMGADIVIAVDVSTHWFDVSSFSAGSLSIRNIHSIFHAMISVLGYQLSKNIIKTADVVVRPPVLGYDWFDFRKAEAIIAAGYKTAKSSMAEICKATGCEPPPKDALEKFWDFVFNLD